MQTRQTTRQTARLSLTLPSEEETTYTSHKPYSNMDPTDDPTPPPTDGSPTPSPTVDSFNVDELFAQLPAVQQQLRDGRTSTTLETAPYEEEDQVPEQEEDYDYETPTPPEELPDLDPRDGEETLPPNDHPRAPRNHTLMALLLKNKFLQVFGDEWQKSYVNPYLRRALLREIRASIGRNRNRAVVQGDNTAGARPDGEPRFSCYLTRFFGASSNVTFPTCSRRTD